MQTTSVYTHTSLLAAVKGLLPIVLVVITGTSQYFTLQGQVIELRAKYEASTSNTRDALEDVKNDLRETNTLLRDLLRRKEEAPSSRTPLNY
jgi:hypothetical protein